MMCLGKGSFWVFVVLVVKFRVEIVKNLNYIVVVVLFEVVIINIDLK